MTDAAPKPLTAEEIKARHRAARKAFRRFWIGGMAVAFFSAIVRSLPIDWKTHAWPANWGYTADVMLHYGYMLWFSAYFFLTAFNTDQEETELDEGSPETHTKADIAFDVVQFASATVAVSFLAASLTGYPWPSLKDLLPANITIALIGFVSIPLFAKQSSADIQKLRLHAGLAALISIGVIFLPAEGFWTLLRPGLLVVALIFLCVVLGRYYKLRIDTPSSQGKSEPFKRAAALPKTAANGAPAAPMEAPAVIKEAEGTVKVEAPKLEKPPEVPPPLPPGQAK